MSINDRNSSYKAIHIVFAYHSSDKIFLMTNLRKIWIRFYISLNHDKFLSWYSPCFLAYGFDTFWLEFNRHQHCTTLLFWSIRFLQLIDWLMSVQCLIDSNDWLARRHNPKPPRWPQGQLNVLLGNLMF